MNEKEIAEIRRRFRPEKSSIGRVRGCFVNTEKTVISEFDLSLASLHEEEHAEILKTLRKIYSGAIGKNLTDIEFSTAQVTSSPEHALLCALRQSELRDGEAVKRLYETIISSFELEDNYLIMLAYDCYDVPAFGKDGEELDDSTESFRYFVCAVCPIKTPKSKLEYVIHEGLFRAVDTKTVVGAPALGFMFPAFDDRTANIYKALYYTGSTADNYPAVADALFSSTLPMSADEQKATFDDVLEQTVAQTCNLRVVRSLSQQVGEMVAEHKESKEEEPLTLSRNDVHNMLEHGGVSEEKLQRFDEKFDDAFGKDARLSPVNLVPSRRFEVRTPDVVIKVNPERSDLVRTRVIDGVKYIMICADEDIEVNGVSIHIEE